MYTQEGLPPDADTSLLPIAIAVLGGLYIFQTYLSFRQYRCLHPSVPFPSLLKGVLGTISGAGDGDLAGTVVASFTKAQAYGRDRARFGFVRELYSTALDIAALYFGVYALLWDTAASWTPALLAPSEVATSCGFAVLCMVAAMVVRIPTSLYSTFVVEQRHGFNEQTVALYFKDLALSVALGVVFIVPVVAVVAHLLYMDAVRLVGALWAFLFCVQLALMYIMPLVAPLFNDYTPLPDGDLRTRIEALASELKFPLTRLYVIDGSKRSTHSNAFMFGFSFGPFQNMRIVLYDTLLKDCTEDEIIAVLAHELGHWKLGHVLRNLVLAQVQIIIQLMLFVLCATYGPLYTSFGFQERPPIIGVLFFFNLAFTPLTPLLDFFASALSRRYEFQADEFSVSLGWRGSLTTALVKLALHNKSSLVVDPVYSAVYYSHPPLLQRLQAISESKKKTQ